MEVDIVKVKVIKAFRDKENAFATRPINEVFEASPKRAQDLIKDGFVEKVEPKKTKDN